MLSMLVWFVVLDLIREPLPYWHLLYWLALWMGFRIGWLMGSAMHWSMCGHASGHADDGGSGEEPGTS